MECVSGFRVKYFQPDVGGLDQLIRSGRSLKTDSEVTPISLYRVGIAEHELTWTAVWCWK